jgi:Flp pilus assembly protein TadD
MPASRGLRAFVLLALALAGLGTAWALGQPGSDVSSSFVRHGPLDLAKTAFAERRFARAEELARLAAREHPGSPGVRIFLARVLLERGRLPEAATLFQEALRTDPADLGAVRGLGLAALGLGREQEAVLHLTRVAQGRADDALAWKELALAQRAAGDTAGAMGSARTSLALDQEQADLQRLLTEMATASLRPRHEEAAVRAPRPMDPRTLVPAPQVPEPTRHFPKPEVRR